MRLFSKNPQKQTHNPVLESQGNLQQTNLDRSPNSQKNQSKPKPKAKSRVGKILSLFLIFALLGLFLVGGVFGYSLVSSGNSVFGSGSEEGAIEQFLDTLNFSSNPNKTAELKGESEGRTNFLVIGRDNTAGGITDTMIILSYYHKEKKIVTVNIPRDMLVFDGYNASGGVRSYKINAAYVFANQRSGGNAGEEALISLIEKELEIPIHYWGTISLDGFTDLIDEVGGVRVDVEEKFTEAYPNDIVPAGARPKCQRKVFVEGSLHCEFTFQAGEQKLDGAMAMVYARSRKYTSDFDRSRRQSQIIQGVVREVNEQGVIKNISNIRTYLDILSNNFKTSLTIPEIFSFLRKTEDLDLNNDYYTLNWSTGNGFLCTGGGTGYNIVYCGGSLFGAKSSSRSAVKARNQIQNMLDEAVNKELLEAKVVAIGNRSLDTDKAIDSFELAGFSDITKFNTYSGIDRATRNSIEEVKVIIQDPKLYNLFNSLQNKPRSEGGVFEEVPSGVVLPDKYKDYDVIIWVESI